ncbi:hypothetical protein [Streptacidiphilus carbonis]|uniref:hypothetical protein n=1 Tax=Streptacidiphilus carbonis TaxID=105422 RepID=UPI0006936D40|nr:hypothetical protein [Streptacidiphilus carbonis]
MTVRGGGVVLDIDDAAVGSTGRLTMTVHNEGSVPEHLDMAAFADAGQAVLHGGTSLDGSMTSGGILLPPHSVTDFSGSGPRIQVGDPRVLAGRSSELVRLEFGVTGLVQVRVHVLDR